MITYEQVEKLRIQAKASGGNPSKIAEWKTADSLYKQMVSENFDGETPFTDKPSQTYLDQLAEKALSGNDADITRFQMIKERDDINKRSASGEPARVLKTTAHELRQKVQNGEKLTKNDLQLAGELCAHYATTDNLVLYATIKRNIGE